MLQPATQSTLPNVGARLPILTDQIREYHQTLLAALRQPLDVGGDPPRLVGVTSSTRGEGVSTIAAHLAMVAGESGERRVLLADANHIAPSVHGSFGAPRGPGLCEILDGTGELSTAVRPTASANLWLLPGGQSTVAGQLDPNRIGDLLADMRCEFSFVVFDLPSGEAGGRLVRFGTQLDGVVLVVEAGRTSRDVASRTVAMLQRMHVRILGSVVNKYRSQLPGWLDRRL